MRILQLKKIKDFGTEYQIKFLTTKKWTLVQISVNLDDYVSAPYFQMTMGSNGLFGILFYIYKFGFEISLISRTWNRWEEN